MKWSKNYVDEDRISLDAAATEADISFKYDDNGYITNYTEQMTWLYNQLDTAINNANADGNATEEEQEEIERTGQVVAETGPEVIAEAAVPAVEDGFTAQHLPPQFRHEWRILMELIDLENLPVPKRRRLQNRIDCHQEEHGDKHRD